MNSIMKILVKIVMIFTLVLSLGLPAKIEAVSTSISLGEDSLVDWLLDKDANQIIAITSSGKLHFISLDTFQINKTLDVGANPSDIVRDGNQLFISIPDASKIQKVDLSTNSVTGEIITSDNPYRMAVGNGKLFYLDTDRTLYHYNLTSGEELVVTIKGETYSTFYHAELYLDSQSATLYLAESEVSGGNVQAISTTDYTLLHETTYRDSYGFPYPDRHLVVDGNEIFFAGHKLNQDNLAEIQGAYAEDYSSEGNNLTAADIIAVDANFVYSTKDVFDRNMFKKVATYPSEISHMLINDGKRYTYNPKTYTIQVNSDSYVTPEVRTSFLNNKLLLNHQVDKWIFDESVDRIYAISESSNELLYIDTNTMEVIERNFIGSIPTDLELVDNKIYIALFGTTKIAVADIDPSATITYIETSQNPFELETDGNDLYYIEEDQWTEVFHIDLQTEVERVLEPTTTSNIYSYYEGSILLDSENDILYVGESGSSGSNLLALSTVDGSHLKVNDYDNGYGYPYPGRNVIEDENYVYYAGTRFDKSDLTIESGKYFESSAEDLISLTGNYVVSSKKIYDKTSMQPVYSFPTNIEVNLVNINSEGNVFVSIPSQKAIYKFSSMEELQNRLVQNVKLTNELPNTFKLSWDMVTGDGYNVYAKKSTASTYTKLNTTPIVNQNYTITEQQLKSFYGSTVSFGVKSVFGNAESPGMLTVEHTFDIPVPTNMKWDYMEVPEELKYKYSDPFFRVSWDLNNMMDAYNLYYYTSDNPTFKKKVSITYMPDNEVQFRGYNDSWEGKTLYFELAAVVNGMESKVATLSHYFKPETESEPVLDPAPSNQVPNGDNQTSSNSNQGTANTGSTVNPSTTPTNVVSVDGNNETTKQETEKPTEDSKVYTPSSFVERVYTITIEQFIQIGDGEPIRINLIKNVQKVVELNITEELIRLLIEKGSSLSVQKETTSALIPSSIFAGKEQETTVSIEKLEPVEGALSDVYDFNITQGETKITQFDEPVTLEFQVDPEKVTNPEDVKVYYFNEELQQWELIGGTYEDGVVTAQTNHFSIYSVFEKPPVEVKEHAAEDTKIDSKTVENNTKTSGNKTTSQPSFWSGMIALALIIGFIVFYIRRKKLV